jgi:hypothetical protein
MMLGDKLIEGAVNSYNTIAKKLIDSLVNKETDIEKLNSLYEGLKEHRKTIKRLFKENPVLEVYKPEIRKVIKEIRDNNDIFKKLPFLDEEGINDYYDGIGYVVDINSDYDLENFILRRMEAGAIIVGKKLPTSVIKLFDKIKECYMFGLYEATIIFCRALIEETLKKHYQIRNPKVPKYTIDNMHLDKLLENIVFPKALKDMLYDVKNDAKVFLHRAIFEEVAVQTINITHTKGSFSVKKKNNKSIQQKALSAIRATTSVIEEVF